MFKHLTIALLGVASLLVLAGSAQAAFPRIFWFRNNCGYAEAVVAPVQPAPSVTGQAQSDRRTVRSYSYEPAAPAYETYSRPYRTYRSDPGNNFDAGRKIKGL